MYDYTQYRANRERELEEDRKRTAAAMRGASPFMLDEPALPQYAQDQIMGKEQMTGIQSPLTQPSVPQPKIRVPMDPAKAVTQMTKRQVMTPPTPQQPQQEMGLFDKIGAGISNMVGDPNFRDRLIMASQSLTLNPNQQLMQMAQSNIDERKATAKGKRDANQTADYLESQGFKREAQAIRNNPSMASVVLNDVLARRKASTKPNEALQTALAKQRAEAIVSLPGATRQVEQGIRAIDDVIAIKDDDLEGVLGSFSAMTPTFTEKSAALESKLDSVESQAFINAFESLKGGGTITEAEGQKASEALARLNRAMSPQDYKAAAKNFKSTLIDILNTARMKAGEKPVDASQYGATSQPQVNISGFSYEGFE